MSALRAGADDIAPDLIAPGIDAHRFGQGFEPWDQARVAGWPWKLNVGAFFRLEGVALGSGFLQLVFECLLVPIYIGLSNRSDISKVAERAFPEMCFGQLYGHRGVHRYAGKRAESQFQGGDIDGWNIRVRQLLAQGLRTRPGQ